jgi:hypothetical protein
MLKAVHKTTPETSALVLRGISDSSDERKAELDAMNAGSLRAYAMANAVELLWLFMKLGALPK